MKMFCGKMRMFWMAMTLTFLGAVNAEEKKNVDLAVEFHSKIDVIAMNAGPREGVLAQLRTEKDALLQALKIKEEDLLVALNEEWKTFKTECKTDGEKAATPKVDYSKWMSFLPKETRNAHISSVIFPGTEGSGSYSLYFADTSDPLTKENYLDRYLDAGRCALGRAQDMTIAEQFNASSRYFHFRPMAFQKELVDSFLLDDKTELRGEKLEVYFNEIAELLKKEKSEVVIVDLVSGSKPLPEESVKALSELLAKSFPNMMVPIDIKENEFTLNNLESKQTRVIVISNIVGLNVAFERKMYISESRVESNVGDLERAIKTAIENKATDKALPLLKISWFLKTAYSEEKSFAGRLNKDQTSMKANEAHAAMKQYITKQVKLDTKDLAEKEVEKKEKAKTEEEKKKNDGDDKTEEKKPLTEHKAAHDLFQMVDDLATRFIKYIEQPEFKALMESKGAGAGAVFDEVGKVLGMVKEKLKEAESSIPPAPKRRLKQKQAGKDDVKKTEEKKEPERKLVDPKKVGNIVATHFLGRSSLADNLGIPASSAVSSAVSVFAFVAAVLSFFIAQ